MHPSRHFRRHGQRGTTLIEALIAFVVLAFGALAAAQLQGRLGLQADVARQRSEAVRLGERELERLRAYAAVDGAGASTYAAIADLDTLVGATVGTGSPTAYAVATRVHDAASGAAKSTFVGVQWTDRSGAVQKVALDSVVARSDPAYAGSLALGAGAGRVPGAQARHRAVPLVAVDLGDGRSAWKPAAAGPTWLFDHATGEIVARCAATGAGASALDAVGLGCEVYAARMLAGAVRFSGATPPVAGAANDVPPALSVSLALSGGDYAQAPACSATPSKTVRYSAGGSLRIAAVPIDAVPSSLGIGAWEETGERFVAYGCVVVPRADGRWSGALAVVPSGWALGSGSAERRVCRYADASGGGAATSAVGAGGAVFSDVASARLQQNLLVVRGDENCPAA